jgi:hypothetical protein
MVGVPEFRVSRSSLGVPGVPEFRPAPREMVGVPEFPGVRVAPREMVGVPEFLWPLGRWWVSRSSLLACWRPDPSTRRSAATTAPARAGDQASSSLA